MDKDSIEYKEFCNDYLGDLVAMYPDVFEFRQDGDMYFIDKCLSGKPLRISQHNDFVMFLKTQEKFDIYPLITILVSKKYREGILTMAADLVLSNESCMELFKNNIIIEYYDVDEKKLYDKEAIIRKHIIKNIINE